MARVTELETPLTRGIVPAVLTARFVIGVACGYLAVTLAYVWPLPLRMATGIANDPIDPLLNTWILEWTASRAPWAAGWWDAPAFAPLSGALAMSEHLLGLWPVSAPLLAFGVPSPAVYNLLFIASFALSALTACVLVTELTGSRSAGIVAGCLFGFAPYRLVQVAHLQILAAWWGPIALLALHRQAARGGWRWAVVFACSWLLLSLTSGYHLAFFSIVAAVAGAWLFVGRGRWRHAWPVLVTTACAALLVLPLILGYQRVHAREGLTRQPLEIEEYAADATHLLKVPGTSLLWGDPRSPYEEIAMFPGAALAGGLLLALVVLGRGRAAPDTSDSPPAVGHSWRPALVLGLIGLVPLTLAVIAATAPGRYDVAGVAVSLSRPSKSLTVAWVLFVLAAAVSPPGVRMWRGRSPVALYAVLIAVTWLLTLGPRARVGGVIVLYHAPYSWLMAIPGGLAMRVAPRFWLWTILAAAVVIGFGLAALRRRASRLGLAAAGLLSVLALADGWPRGVPIADLPAPGPALMPGIPAGTPVVELPLGEPDRDVAAMWRGRRHGHPVVNGYSGYEPAHYRTLDRALEDGHGDVLQVLAEPLGLVVAVERTGPNADALAELAASAGGASAGTDPAWQLFHLSPRPGPAPAGGRRVEPLRVVDVSGADVTDVLTDDDRHSRWSTPGPQRDGEGLIVDLPQPMVVTAVELGQGPHPADYPGHLKIEASTDEGWQVVYDGRPAPEMLRAVLESPTSPILTLSTRAVRATSLRLVLVESHAKRGWSVSTLAVRTP